MTGERIGLAAREESELFGKLESSGTLVNGDGQALGLREGRRLWSYPKRDAGAADNSVGDANVSSRSPITDVGGDSVESSNNDRELLFKY